MFDIQKYYQFISEHDIILSYRGVVDGEAIASIIKLAEKRLLLSKESLKVRKKIINVLVESLQNIVHYFEEEPLEIQYVEQSFLTILKQEEKYIIFTGNLLSMQRAKSLKKRIDNVNAMEQADLHSLYMSVLETPKVHVSRGAGLGFLDMAKRTENKIKYDFQYFNDQYMLFILELAIENSKKVVS
jgi:hypothetical protein